ncbi:MAG TPA: Mur ligase family protein [Kofleriaceae bacterium]|nr:Mur ligase family protein [Kofleriaceae bacterium]
MSRYDELCARLYAARRFGMVLGLDRMRGALDRIGAPDRRLGQVVHVGGTNGKGSTVAMIAALARGGGARVATYTSPHLSTLRERVTIDGELASEDALVDAAREVDPGLTFFEQITAIAMAVIARAGVDITVLEVGLGGRLDATNVVDAPVAVVTGVALDHEAILGGTLEAIAFEKAGIFKRGRAAVIGASGEPAAVPVLVEHARAAGVARLTTVDDDAIARVPDLALAGAHQRRNAAAAVAAIEALGLRVEPAALARVSHPGRFERAGDLVLDGAHNPHGARALAATLRELGMRPVLVVAVSADKDARAIAEALAPEVRAVVATRYQQDRTLAPEPLADAFRAATSAPVETARDLEAAVARARELGGPVLVAGSLFLVGEARTRWLGAPTDAIALADPARPGARAR